MLKHTVFFINEIFSFFIESYCILEKSGHKLEFTAEGYDASVALKAIGDVIDSGLGEK